MLGQVNADYLAQVRAENQAYQDRIKSGELVPDPSQMDQGPTRYVTKDEATRLQAQVDTQRRTDLSKTPDQVKQEMLRLSNAQTGALDQIFGKPTLDIPMKAMPSASGGLGMGSPNQQPLDQTFDPFPAPPPASLPGLSNLRIDNQAQMQRGFMPQGNRGGINQFMNFVQSMMQLYQMFNSQGMGGMGGMGGQQGFGGGFGGGFGEEMPQMGGMQGGYQGYAPPVAPRMQRQTFGGPFGGY
tara:strand:+ start:277 stop:999 length:723 start_codon:yes stop_codon:yes gene_type:complete